MGVINSKDLSKGLIHFNNILRNISKLLKLQIFGSILFHSLMTCRRKEFLKYSVLQGNEKCWGLRGSFSFVEVSYEYVMIARLKGIYRARTITSSIFFVGGTQASNSLYNLLQRGHLIVPATASSVLHYIAQFCLKMMHWTIGHKWHHHSQDEVYERFINDQ